MFSLLARSDLRRRRANCCPPPTRRGWNLTTPPSPAFLRWPPAKNSFAFKAVQSDHIRIKEENDNGTQTAQYAAQTYFEYWILQCPIPRISKYWILQYVPNQKYQRMVAGARSTSRANARSLGLVSLRPQRIGDYHQFTIIFFINIIIKITRPKPGYGRQGLDWIVGPGYSFVVISTNKTMETNQKPW